MRPIAIAIPLALLAGCAAGPDPGMGGPAGPPPGLFVSPFGELFIAQPGDPWPTAAWVSGADADQDGRLTLAEFVADGRRVFADLDLNPDGLITPAEVVVYERTLAAARSAMPGLAPPGMRGPGGPRPPFPGGSTLGVESPQQMPGGGGMPGGGMPGGAGGRAPPPGMPRMRAPTGPLAYGPIAAAGFFNYPQPVKAADFDMNQTITSDEWARATDRWFVVLDTDRDGTLSLETLPKTPLQTLSERRSR